MSCWQSKTRNQYFATISATGTSLISGLSYAWTSPVQSQIVENDEDGTCSYDFCVTKTEFPFIGSTLVVGAMMSGLLASHFMQKIGRKRTLILFCCVSLCGWIALAFGRNKEMLYVGRFLTGVAHGGIGPVSVVYISEIAVTKIRGKLLSFVETSFQIGLVVSYTLGYLFSMKIQNFASILILIGYLTALFFIPESPRYFVFSDRLHEARRSLLKLRTKCSNPDVEIQEILELSNSREKKSKKALFTDKTNRKCLFIALGLVASYHLTGINAILFYLAEILKNDAFQIDPNLLALFVGITSAIATIISLSLVDKIGRKILLLISLSVTILTTSAMGTYFWIKTQNPELINSWNILPLIIMPVYIFVNSLGIAPITFVIIGEIFHQDVKEFAAALCTTWIHVCSLSVTLMFPMLNQLFGFSYSFFGFSFISFVALIFVYSVVPETKGKSFQEIQRMISKSQ